MGYAVGDKVEVKDALIKDDGKRWKVWLVEIVPMKSTSSRFKPDQVWVAKYTRVSHSALVSESMITKKISSNFEGYK